MKEDTVKEKEKKERTSEKNAQREKHRNVIRIVSSVVFVLAMLGITYLLLPILKCLGQEGWQEEVQKAVTSHGKIGGLLIFLAIQALQVIVAVVPAVQAVGGVLYGWFFGAIVSFAGIVIGALAVWGIVKKLGKPLVEAAVGEKHLKRFRFLEDERKLTVILIILFIIPGVPKDVVTYIVPLTKVKMRDFFFCVLPFRIPSIILTTALGSNITSGNYVGAIVISAVILVIAVLGLIFKDKILDSFNKLHRARRHGTEEQTADK